MISENETNISTNVPDDHLQMNICEMTISKIDLADFGDLFRSNPANLSDQELLSLDFLLHRAWKHKRDGGKVYFGNKSWSFEDLANLHALVRQEMSKRGFQHTTNDELDQQTQPFLKSNGDLAPVYPSGVELGRPLTLNEVLPQIKSFYPHPIFGWIVGGLANWGQTKGDIDVLWWAPPEFPGYLKKILELRFGRQFKDPEIAGRVQHHLNYFQGPFSKAVPIYALKVERINPKGEIKQAGHRPVGLRPDFSLDGYAMMQEIDLEWDESHRGWTIPKSWLRHSHASINKASLADQLRSASAEFIAQAEASAKEDKIELFHFFIPLKPTKGHTPDEAQTVDNFLKFFSDTDFPVYSSKKFDGADYVIFRDGDRVQMISEDGRDDTSRFPLMVQALKNLPVKRFAVVAEVEHWDHKNHLPRETVIAYVNANSQADDSDFIANVYDVLYFESDTDKSGDIHNRPWTERLKFLDTLDFPQSTDVPADLSLKLNLVPHYPAANKEELRVQTEKLRRLEGSEGNVVCTHDFVYNLENKPSGKIKFHNAAILHGIVTQATESKTPGVFNYFYGLAFQNMPVPKDTIRQIQGKPYHEIGTTFSSTLKATVGNIIQVEFETLNLTRDIKQGTVAVTAYAPRVLGLSDHRIPMTIGEAVKAAKAGFVFQEKEITPEGETLFKGVRQAFGSYGGKHFLAHKIASYIPHHRTYAEPFAGGAAVLFAKDRSPQEILNDRDSEIAFMYRFIRDHTPAEHQALAKRNWVINKETHERLKKLQPSNDAERFYKDFYLTRSSYGKKRGADFNPANDGVRIDFQRTIEGAQKRLQNVSVHNRDYLDVLKKYDGEDTFFYMDPPYPEKFNLFDFGFEEKSFLKALKKLKAKWIVSYPSERAAVFKGYNVYRVKRRNQMKGPGDGPDFVTELLVSNFPLKPVHLYIQKNLTADPEGMELESPPFLSHLEEPVELEKIQGAFKSPGGKFRMAKKLVALIPQHKTFVEGFCGGAQVFFHKSPSTEEVLNDVNPDLVFAYRFIKSMKPQDLNWLKNQNWVISRSKVKKVFEMKPRTPRERFYRFTYLNKSTYWGDTNVLGGVRTGPKGEGYHIQLLKRLSQIQERLKGVKLHSWDWKQVIKEYDSPETFFYLDPPYPLHWPRNGGGVGSKFFKEEELMPTLEKIKGKFLLSYELEKNALFKGFRRYRIKTLWSGARQLGSRKKFELLVSNFPLEKTDLYLEKSVDLLFDESILKQDDLFDTYPPEDQAYRYVMQHHWRGKTVHVDFRMENGDKDLLIGWTLADLIPGVVKESVTTLDEARKWSEDGSPFKIDFQSGHFKERQTRADNVVPAQIRAFPKAKEPHLWLDVEGVTPPFPAPGATRNFPGVFFIEDKGICEYGAQKLDAHEYFLNGKLKGRLLIRRLAREALQSADQKGNKANALPPGNVDESPTTDTTFWVAIQPLDQTPLVLTDREVEKQWIPPFGISALPQSVRELIPPDYRYWTIKDPASALKARDALVQALKAGKITIDFNKEFFGHGSEITTKKNETKFPFVLQYQTFRGPLVVRSGPSKEFWTVRVAMSTNRVLSLQLSSNPLTTAASSATLSIERTNKFLDVEGELPPGSLLNPTKNTPSSIAILDKGEALVLSDSDTIKEFEFHGKKLKGVWTAKRPDTKTVLWEFSEGKPTIVAKDVVAVQPMAVA